MVYEFSCDCGCKREVVCGWREYEANVPTHCGKVMDWVPSAPGFKFTYTAGKETGVYAYDYGKCATYDLTVPGKIERLKRDGRIHDPFDSAPQSGASAGDASYFGDDSKDVV